MTRPPVLRALLALLILGVTGFFAVTKDPRLGLDLRGGTQIVLETKDSPTTEADAEATDRTLEVLRRRVDALGVAEPTLARSGTNRIIVELPGVQNAAEAADAIGQTAQLTFHPVLGPGDPANVVGLQPEELEPEDEAPEFTPASPTAEATAGASAAPSATSNGRALPPALTTQTQASPAPTASASPAPAEPQTDPQELDTSQQNSILDESGQPILIGPAALTGDDVGDAAAGTDPTTGTQRFVSVDFQGEGGRKWEALTGAAACNQPLDPKRRVAIVLDGQAISSPQVAPDVQCNIGIQGGSTQITGNFTRDEAQQLAVLIKGGALPVRVEIISRSTVGPSLGQEAIDASVKAGIIGLSMTAIFLMVVYRVVGLLAAVALASYGLISYGVLVAIGATLTLPGLGGLLLSAGLAIDANVLVFERTREEFAASRHKRLLPSLDNGFSKAFTAIADSNITTLIAAALLFLFAAGPVRGFGVTLTIGVLASIVSALLVTRVLTEFAVKRGLVHKRPRISGLATLGRFREYLERRKPDLMQFRRRWLMISALALLLAISGMFLRGFNFGVEFTGGRVVEFATSQPVSVGDARSAVEEAGFPTAVVQQSNGENISVRTANIDDDEVERIRASLAEVGGDASINADDLIGPTLGSELRKKAIIALVIALVMQLGYLAIRFRWTFASAAVLAMFHDVLIVLGIFAWLGKPIDGIFLAAALTIIGVSVNDSIVTMDRIRETWANNRTRPLAGVVNTAVLSTAPRTVNTGLGAMFILGALTFLGGRSLTDFALALLIGLIVGTYSSAFTAAPLLLLLEQRNSAPPPMPKRRTGSASSRPRPAKRPAPRPMGVRREGGVV
ncbi:MAG: protein translocase subunit SecD [Mycobacteriales bacterium]